MSSGRASISATFEKGTDPDIAQVQVQNKVQQALPRLPQQVQQQGLTVTKSNPDFLLIAAVYDITDQRSNVDVSDYLSANMQDEIGRLRSEEHTSELQSLMRISYAVFCLKTKQSTTNMNKIRSNENMTYNTENKKK